LCSVTYPSTEILKYNEEDLATTWAVFDWLRGKGNAAQAATPLYALRNSVELKV
jgi:hypothetical protein